jgi:Zn-dependent protease
VTRFRPPQKSWHAFGTALAGPSAGLLLGLVAGSSALVARGSRARCRSPRTLATINIFWSLFNLLPMLPLDGGNMLLHALQMATAPSTADTVARGISVVVAIAAGRRGLVRIPERVHSDRGSAVDLSERTASSRLSRGRQLGS